MYKINEIFYSLQGEGFWTGTPSIFIRFSGCNLQCAFCDTLHEEGKMMSEEEILSITKSFPAKHVVLTGGEPSLFVKETLLEKLHAQEKFIAIETNGTHELPKGIDWITLSPKKDFQHKATPILKHCDELKIVYTNTEFNPYLDIETKHRYLQPCDTGNLAENKKILQATIDFIKANPSWQLSLQIHKIIGVQ